MPLHTGFITETLGTFEGAAKCRGYVPAHAGKALGNSGVTIGTGVDLGQHTAEGLAAMRVPHSVIGLLVPYLGLQKEAAQKRLKTLPLILSPESVHALDQAVTKHFIDTVERIFDHRAARCGASFFADRPRQVQAVAVSLCYQLGPKGCPRTLDLLAQGRYADASQELENSAAWGHRYMARRRAEAALIRQVCQP